MGGYISCQWTHQCMDDVEVQMIRFQMLLLILKAHRDVDHTVLQRLRKGILKVHCPMTRQHLSDHVNFFLAEIYKLLKMSRF